MDETKEINSNASAMARKRWAKTSDDARHEHAIKMLEARLAKTPEAKPCVVCGIRKDLRYFGGHLTVCKQCRGSAKQRAYRQVLAAVRRGDLPQVSSLSCVDCNEPAQQYDHRDYRKPLDVVAVCRRCNLKRGSAVY